MCAVDDGKFIPNWIAPATCSFILAKTTQSVEEEEEEDDGKEDEKLDHEGGNDDLNST